ncbi:MAG: hypothetical protein IT290_02590 [Deltaproteobacteria bacterium]|nr:hypothetical protein [Deltaproteobacteria bacterium]
MKEFFTKNIRLKLASLLLAISFEMYFLSPTNLAIETIKVPIDILNVPPSMMTMAPVVPQDGLHADVRIRGPLPIVRQALDQPHRFLIRVPENPGVERSFLLPLSESQLGLPQGIQVVSIEPRDIEVKLERTMRKEVPVFLEQEGSPREGYFIEEVEILPSKVVVTGPESEIQRLDFIETELLHIGELKETRTLEVSLVPNGPRTTYETKNVRVRVTLSPKQSERSFDSVKVGIAAPSGVAATVEPTRAKCTLTGADDVLKKLSERDFELFADLDGLGQGTHEVALKAKLPTGVKLLAVNPARARVHVAENEKKTEQENSR